MRADSNQLSLFNEAETVTKPFAPEPKLEIITYKRRKKKSKNDKLEGLTEVTTEYSLSEDEQICPNCQGPLHVMSQQIRRELEIIPAQVRVHKHVQNIYSCRNCEHNGIGEEQKVPVITAPKPNPVIPQSVASPSAVAYVIEQKYVNAMPLYRQEQQWERLGVSLSRQTMANWIIYVVGSWLDPLFNRMKIHLLEQDIIQADETTLQVLHEPGKTPQSQSYMWLYRSGRDGPPIVLYEYQTSRSGFHPKKFLQGFRGFLQTDGYVGYNQVENVTHVGCWSHARRYFFDALQALPKSDSKTRVQTKAEEGLGFCNQLFALERQFKDRTGQERYKLRLEYSRPLLDAFSAWLHETGPAVLPKSAIGKAITYCLNQWTSLVAFLQDGRLEIDNNRSERSIKSFVISRKNFLFSNTPRVDASVLLQHCGDAQETFKPFEISSTCLKKCP